MTGKGQTLLFAKWGIYGNTSPLILRHIKIQEEIIKQLRCKHPETVQWWLECNMDFSGRNLEGRSYFFLLAKDSVDYGNTMNKSQDDATLQWMSSFSLSVWNEGISVRNSQTNYTERLEIITTSDIKDWIREICNLPIFENAIFIPNFLKNTIYFPSA